MADGVQKIVSKDGKVSYRVRYYGGNGREYSKRGFETIRDARAWRAGQLDSLSKDRHVTPRDAKVTVHEWADYWQRTHSNRTADSVRAANMHIRLILAEFGERRLGSIQPSEVKAWVVKLQAIGYKDSTIHSVYKRLAQLYNEAIADGILTRSPCGRKVSPKPGQQRVCLISAEQVWRLHDALDPRFRPAVLLAAFAGLRLGEVAGIHVADIDFAGNAINPARQ